MKNRRQSFESGHRRKLLIVLDDTEECRCALQYAGRRASRTDSVLIMLYVIPPIDNPSSAWIRIDDLLRAETRADADKKIESFRELLRIHSGIEPEIVVSEGERAVCIQDLVESDTDIAILILGAASGKDGPGPLIANLVSQGGSPLSVPITIVPGNLTEDEIISLT